VVLVLAAGLALCRDGRGLFSVQMEGGQKFPTGLQIDITGTEGVLRITNDRAFENTEDNTVHGVNTGSGNGPALAVLPVPEEYRSLPDASLDESVQDLAHLYAAFARDKAHGTTEATTFADAVTQHHLIGPHPAVVPGVPGVNEPRPATPTAQGAADQRAQRPKRGRACGGAAGGITPYTRPRTPEATASRKVELWCSSAGRLYLVGLGRCGVFVVVAEHSHDGGGRGSFALLLALGDEELGGDVAQALSLVA
jgi:hypothetical protein